MGIIKISDEMIKVFGETIYDTIEMKLINKVLYWFIHWRYRVSVKLTSWLKPQIEKPSDVVLAVAKKIDNYSNPDRQMIEILRWVEKNIVYESDQDNWDLPDYWQTAEETINLKTGDCEDGAILIYVLARLKGIPFNRLLIFAGDVNGGGHCWLGYKPKNYPLNFVFLDWCYYYDARTIGFRDMFVIKKSFFEFQPSGIDMQIPMPSSNYLNMWIGFNEDTSVTEVKNYGNGQ